MSVRCVYYRVPTVGRELRVVMMICRLSFHNIENDVVFDDSLRGLKVRFGARCSDFNLVSCLIDLDKVVI